MEEKVVDLDLKDKKLLYELDFNARATYSFLAKKVGLSKQGVEYRINSLIKKGVIKGFYPIIDVPKLGYIYCRLSVTLQNTTKEKKKEIIDYLIKHPKVFWLFDMQGEFDLFFAVWAKSLTEFKDFIEEFEDKFGSHIKNIIENIATDLSHFQHRYLLNKTETKVVHVSETSERVDIDSIDKEILILLCKDARISLVDIAEHVNESAKVVAYRIKRMEKKGLIKGYRPIINNSILGYTYYKLFINLNKISKDSVQRLKNYIKNSPLVIYIIDGIALNGDLDIEIMVKSNQELFNFIEDLRFKFPELVGEYQSVVFLNTLKVRYLPF